MNHAEYIELPGINQSFLKKINDSPLHFRDNIDNPKPGTDDQALGRYLHTLALEPEQVAEDYAFFTGKTARGKAWDDFAAEAEAAGKTVIKSGTDAQQRKIAEIQSAAAAVRAHPIVADMLANEWGQAEQCFMGVDEETGVPIKCRSDLVVPGIWSDLKGVDTTDSREFGKLITKNGWDAQGAFNGRCMVANDLPAPDLYRMIVVETSAPNDVAVYTIPNEYIDAANIKITRWLNLYAACTKSGEWPGRQPVERACEDVQMPPWALPKDQPNHAPQINGIMARLANGETL